MIFRLKRAKRQRGEQATILMFDIPEEKRTYRNFLRRLLKQIDFTMIQKSVFIASYILPKEFYDLLRELDLLRFVKVIEGSIRYYSLKCAIAHFRDMRSFLVKKICTDYN
jgi:CRISPR-associated endonuclease Cas2